MIILWKMRTSELGLPWKKLMYTSNVFRLLVSHFQNYPCLTRRFSIYYVIELHIIVYSPLPSKISKIFFLYFSSTKALEIVNKIFYSSIRLAYFSSPFLIDAESYSNHMLRKKRRWFYINVWKLKLSYNK